jgi:transcriptional regulator with XRE-family HTH domain
MAATERHDSVAFGEVLREHREAAGLSQEALAARSGVSSDTISQWERGVVRQPRRSTLKLLADALGLKEAARETFVAAAGAPPRRPVLVDDGPRSAPRRGSEQSVADRHPKRRLLSRRSGLVAAGLVVLVTGGVAVTMLVGPWRLGQSGSPPGAVATHAPAPGSAGPAQVSGASGFSFEDGGTDRWGGTGHITSIANGPVAHDGGHSLQLGLYSASATDFPYASVRLSEPAAPTSGQTVSLYTKVAAGSATVHGWVFVQDLGFGWHQSQPVALSASSWTRLSITVPPGIRVNGVGVQFQATPVNTNATVYVDSVSWA